MEIVAKLTDALGMFWQSLDERERRYLLYLTAYVAVTVIAGLHKLTEERKRERLKAELLVELQHGSG